MANKEIQQGKFYNIEYADNYKKDTIETTKTLKVGHYYRLTNGRLAKVLNKVQFKYTYEDIDNIRIMTEDYDKGTVQYNLCERMLKAFQEKTPAVRFTREDREILSYIYYENEHISDKHRKTLEKVLNIKRKK